MLSCICPFYLYLAIHTSSKLLREEQKTDWYHFFVLFHSFFPMPLPGIQCSWVVECSHLHTSIPAHCQNLSKNKNATPGWYACSVCSDCFLISLATTKNYGSISAIIVILKDVSGHISQLGYEIISSIVICIA